MARQKRHVLRVPQWPADDQARWAAAFRPPRDLFDEGGHKHHLRPRTRASLAYAHGLWLGFLETTEPDALQDGPVARVTRDRLRRWNNTLAATWSARARGSLFQHLRQALLVLEPGADLRWMGVIATRLAGPHRPLLPPPVDLAEISANALVVMDDLATRPDSAGKRRQYRDALIIAVLCEAPVRRENIAAVEIGVHLVRSGAQWGLTFTDNETKTGKRLDYPLSQALGRRLEHYLSVVRPKLLRGHAHLAFWVGPNGDPLTDGGIYTAVRTRMHQWFGIDTGLHAFRRAAAVFHARHNAEQVLVARDLLGHTRLATTHGHYILTGTVAAAEQWQKIAKKRRMPR